jgi:lipoate-protein ligase A
MTIGIGESPDRGSPFEHVATALDRLRTTAGPVRELRITTPTRLIAFSRRDERNSGFSDALQCSREEGFESAVRPVGGTFAPMHPGSLVVEEFGSEDGLGPIARFDRHVAQLVAVFQSFGIDARVGEVAGEYCPGAYSVNLSGQTKLSGTAQRVVRGAWLVSSVVQVEATDPLRRVTERVAASLDATVDLRTIGALQDVVPTICVNDVTDRLRRTFNCTPFEVGGRL